MEEMKVTSKKEPVAIYATVVEKTKPDETGCSEFTVLYAGTAIADTGPAAFDRIMSRLNEKIEDAYERGSTIVKYGAIMGRFE